MTRSIERILTTHVGSLPRSAALVALLYKKEDGEPYDHSAFDAAIATAVDEAVAKQAEIGIDVVSDGEMGKARPTSRTDSRASPVTTHGRRTSTSRRIPNFGTRWRG
jgi:5-methyltetrahydropteroyltriglutamate--homocysteine methyltransferase